MGGWGVMRRRRRGVLLAVALAVAAMAVPMHAGAAGPYDAGATGFDVSFPQCPYEMPSPGNGVAVVGLTDGAPFATNRCFDREWAWASTSPSASVYVNLRRTASEQAFYGWTGPQASCATADEACAAYDLGWDAATDAVWRFPAHVTRPVMWWLDVETGDDWSCTSSCNVRVNAALVQGAIDYLLSQGLLTGIYSNPKQWGILAGGATPGLPVWTTGWEGSPPETHCGDSFAGGPVLMVQGTPGLYDPDYVCPGGTIPPAAAAVAAAAPNVPVPAAHFDGAEHAGPAAALAGPVAALGPPVATVAGRIGDRRGLRTLVAASLLVILLVIQTRSPGPARPRARRPARHRLRSGSRRRGPPARDPWQRGFAPWRMPR